MSTHEHYEAVLKDLEEERAGIAAEREELAARQQALGGKEEELAGLIGRLADRAAAIRDGGPYAGLSILEAAALLLGERGSSMMTGDITDKILAGGVESKAAQPKATVYGVLHREDGKKGTIEKTGSNEWGLRKWSEGMGDSVSAHAEAALAEIASAADPAIETLAGALDSQKI